MQRDNSGSALVLGVFILLGLAALGYLLGEAAIRFKGFERSVTVKGLSEQEFPADVVIWPIQFTLADNDLGALYGALADNAERIHSFLQVAGIAADEISVSAPVITDKSAQSYGGAQQPEFRYSAVQTVTVYSGDVERVRGVMERLVDLGRQGIALTGGDYQNQTEYLFTRLNEVKPAMIEAATRQAREVALKFAQDSNSRLGKIRRASQGQFSISPRDKNNPHIKNVRVVSTIEYYLSD